MADNGVIVTFGGISMKKYDSDALSYFLTTYNTRVLDGPLDARSPQEEVQECFKSIYNLIKNNQLTIPIAGTYTSIIGQKH
jgi:NADPH:quinone reductase-like Zn-dependent oxidoreductase